MKKPATKRTAVSRSAKRSSVSVGEAERARALKLWVVLARAYAAIQREVDADIARHDLTTTEFGILEALYHKGPLLLGDIQRKVLVTSGGITYLVDRLMAKGFVVREPSPSDRRARYAVLTPAGSKLVRRVFPAHADCVARALAGLDAREQADATVLLRTLGLAAAERHARR
ncbi:MAG: MarR family transcriptional regulator [Gemmatimonadaceae bacterium]|nr:MarR family transcriptional regulator [Gemmatimonadaceae bacterium]